MTRRLIFIIGLMLSYMASGLFYAAQASEPTRIKIGLAGATPNQSVQGLNISTAQIDEILNDYGGPLGIGNNYTTNLANEAFADIEQIKTNLENQVRSDLLKNSKINRVYEVEFDANPAQIRLYQDSTRIGVKVGSLEARLSFKYEFGWCGSYRVTGAIKDVTLDAEYDVYSGRISTADVNYDITQLGASPYGVNGWICKNVIDGLAKILTGDGIKTNLKKILEKGLQEGSNQIMMEELFSLREFLDSTEMLIQTVESPNFSYAGYSLPPIPVSTRQDAAEAVRRVNDILGNPSFQGTGLRVTFDLYDGANSNLISLIVSHAPSKIHDIEIDGECGTAMVGFGVRTEKADIYWRPSSYGGWIKSKTTYRNGTVGLGKIQDGAQFIAIGKSNLFGNLYSKPENEDIYTYRRDWNRPQPIYDTFCEGFLDDGDFPDFPDFPAFP